MTSRRQFLTGLLAAGLAPKPTWAEAGSPAFLSSAALLDGSYVLCGIGADLDLLFQIPLPERGHAAAAHPSKPEAVAFARRPGTFALVIDCIGHQVKAELSCPRGRHFYGHGVFSSDGSWLFTTENDFEAGQGIVGVWDVRQGYRRSAEFPSGGIGPHDIKRLPGTDMLVIANGGIETHPDSGRTKLNIADMAPNLAYIANGAVIGVAELGKELRKNSIRHLAVSKTGQVAFAMQWQGPEGFPPLVGMHAFGTQIKTFFAPALDLEKMQGYAGSIAFAGDERHVAVTSPRGGNVHIYDAIDQSLAASIQLSDVSGVAAFELGVVISSGRGVLKHLSLASRPKNFQSSHIRWDNHLVAL